MRVESNRKAIRLLRGWLDRMECSTSSVPLEVSSGGVSPVSTSGEFKSTNSGSSAEDTTLLFRQQFVNKSTSPLMFTALSVQ